MYQINQDPSLVTMSTCSLAAAVWGRKIRSPGAWLWTLQILSRNLEDACLSFQPLLLLLVVSILSATPPSTWGELTASLPQFLLKHVNSKQENTHTAGLQDIC